MTFRLWRCFLFKWLTSLQIPSKENSSPSTNCNHDLILPHKISFILAVSQVKHIQEDAGQLKKITLRVNQHILKIWSVETMVPVVLREARPITVSFHCLLQPGLAPLCARLIGCVHRWAFFATQPYVTRKLQDCHCSAACFQMVQFLRQFTARPTLARDHCHKISKLRF